MKGPCFLLQSWGGYAAANVSVACDGTVAHRWREMLWMHLNIAKLKWPNSFWKHSRRGNWRSLRAVILGVFWGVHNHSQDCPESVCKHASAQLHLLAHLLPLFKFLVSMAAASRSQHCWGSNQCCSEFSLLLRMPSLILNSVKQSRATEWVIHVANH